MKVWTPSMRFDVYFFVRDTRTKYRLMNKYSDNMLENKSLLELNKNQGEFRKAAITVRDNASDFECSVNRFRASNNRELMVGVREFLVNKNTVFGYYGYETLEKTDRFTLSWRMMDGSTQIDYFNMSIMDFTQRHRKVVYTALELIPEDSQLAML